MRRTPLLVAAVLGLLRVTTASGQEPTQSWVAAAISGTVVDSLARAPLAGAIVQLVDASGTGSLDITTTSDSLGFFGFRGLPEGRYVIGFHHPMLDSLGLDPVVRGVTVADHKRVRVDLAIPGPKGVQAALCGTPQGGGPRGLVMGVVRSARDGSPVPGASVVAEWPDTGSNARALVRRASSTRGSGWFVVCGAPGSGTVFLSASSGADGSDRVETETSTTGFLRRDLFVGEAVTVPAGSAAAGAASARRSGSGQVSGVVRAYGGAPVPGTQVRVVNGPQTQADARGEWALTGTPSGTRLVEMSAPGYRPLLIAVDIAGAAPPIEVELQPVVVALAAIDVVAAVQSKLARNGFEDRRRTLLGQFLTTAHIERRVLWDSSDLLRFLPGMYVEDDTIQMRSVFGERCVPAVILNGMRMRELSPNQLNAMVHPREIAAVEVYLESQVPPQFQDPLSGCGSIVIWTR